nr:unnamed protein product [Callosobruchus chinensis]
MIVSVLCYIVVVIPLSSAQYLPLTTVCPGTFSYVFENGQIIVEVRVPYDSSSTVALTSID